MTLSGHPNSSCRVAALADVRRVISALVESRLLASKLRKGLLRPGFPRLDPLGHSDGYRIPSRGFWQHMRAYEATSSQSRTGRRSGWEFRSMSSSDGFLGSTRARRGADDGAKLA